MTCWNTRDLGHVISAQIAFRIFRPWEPFPRGERLPCGASSDQRGAKGGVSFHSCSARNTTSPSEQESHSRKGPQAKSGSQRCPQHPQNISLIQDDSAVASRSRGR
jgi:hypothetical protein